jgi:hypothetical protein
MSTRVGKPGCFYHTPFDFDKRRNVQSSEDQVSEHSHWWKRHPVGLTWRAIDLHSVLERKRMLIMQIAHNRQFALVLTLLLLPAISLWAEQKPKEGPVSVVVTCELRWIEAPRTEVNKLFASTTYILTPEQLRQVNEWVEQKKATVLAQPRLSTISGVQAEVRSVRELIYPLKANLTPTLPSSFFTTAGSPSLPFSFKIRELGAILKVTLTASPDRSSINATIIPECSKLLGRLKYDVYSPQGKSSFEQPDILALNKTISINLPNRSTVLLTIFDPQPKGKDDTVVIALFSAAIHPIQ